jgi:TetR/AcrR family transcriptional regulator, tetracycline repressor protein
MPVPAPRNPKRPFPKLDANRIGEAALNLVEADGLSALSARRLASALGCEAMSLYNHVSGMGAIQDLIVDRLLGSLLGQDPLTEPRQAISNIAQAYLSLASAYPNAFPLIAVRPWRTPNALAFAAFLVACLEKLGHPPRSALRQVRILSAYAHGAGMTMAAWHAPQNDTEAGEFEGGGSNQETSPDAAAVLGDLQIGLERLIEQACRLE